MQLRWLVQAIATTCAALGMTAHAAEIEAGLGLPRVSAPSGNATTPQKVALGRRLFFDSRLSANGEVSCATCHQVEKAFSDGKPVAIGLNGRQAARNTPSLVNAAFSTSHFWDGRRASLEEQALDPLVNQGEHGLGDETKVLAIVNADPGYRNQFAAAFGDAGEAVTMPRTAMAIAAFVRSLVAGDSAFDRYFYGKDASALTPSAINGLTIFRGRGGCASCHRIEDHHALFTDGDFHSLAVGFERISARLPLLLDRASKRAGSLDDAIFADAELAELGRFLVTGKPADIGKFRTPSLRNVALTAPYMHDGSVPTLDLAVEREIYYRGIEAKRPLVLTMQQKADLVEFLKSLTSANLPR